MQLRQPFSGYYGISLDFGETYPPYYTKEKPHKGIDYLCPLETPILAAADGRVMTVGWEPEGYGHYVILVHEDGSGTVYAHLSSVDTRLNDGVKKGDVIGHSGTSGNSTGPHLHFEYRTMASKASTATDPKLFMQCVYSDSIAEPEKRIEDNTENYNIRVRHEQQIDGGLCIVVCDAANVRDAFTFEIRGQLYRGSRVVVSPDVVWYNNLPYHYIFDNYMLIAEYDNYGTDILQQMDN